MLSNKKLSIELSGAIVLAALWGTSVFAESRHHEGTNRSSGGRIQRSESGSGVRGSEFGRFEPRSGGQRFESRGGERRIESRGDDRRFESRSNDRRFESRGSERRIESRGDDRRLETRSNDRRFESRGSERRFEPRSSDRRFESRGNERRIESRNDGRRFESRGDRRVEADRFRGVPGWQGRGAPYRAHERVTSYGRVDRFVRDHRGYRVWIGGGLYPIFIPFDHWYRHPLRVGLFIRFGGYWDPLGYWSVYDYSPYDRYGSYDRAYTAGTVHGVVESVDYRRGTLVINDDISRQFVTVTMPRDRRMDDVRPGDSVEFSGDWTRGGIFDAYRLDRWDEGRDNDRY